ncbi:MAG: hypothetical protein KL863_20540 [Rhizobium sp.]|nr:hypothetical protein [Rhizobium sp.]
MNRFVDQHGITFTHGDRRPAIDRDLTIGILDRQKIIVATIRKHFAGALSRHRGISGFSNHQAVWQRDGVQFDRNVVDQRPKLPAGNLPADEIIQDLQTLLAGNLLGGQEIQLIPPYLMQPGRFPAAATDLDWKETRLGYNLFACAAR